MKRFLPILIVLVVLILLGYPLALLFGLPLARRDMKDLRKWEKETISLSDGVALAGQSDGSNTVFTYPRAIVENDDSRTLFVNDSSLIYKAERPEERVDGERADFHFESDHGLVVQDGVLLSDGDYVREQNLIRFRQTPPRNAQLRQYPDYFVQDSERGEVVLGAAPETGARVWTDSYTIYARPACGDTLMACFFSLPQHPVPFPHWIAARVVPFFQKFPLTDERNIVRSTLYTSLGTLSSLALGGAVGIILAVLFVMFRPLERALLPWTIASQTIPIIALVPVLLLVLGNFGITIQTSLLPTAIIGAYICFFPVVVSTVKGLRAIDPLILDLMKSYAAKPLEIFWKVRFPAAVPFFFTGLKLGTAAALVGALVAETESNNRRGLGFQILGQVQSGNVADVWILLIISGLLGVGLVAFVGLLQRLFAPWERV
ncbi:MAG: ABC transporter permease subunit [Trueperaceae bacterium]|nr:ABC transporter permease subunit [Trueperaceae bacterium]